MNRTPYQLGLLLIPLALTCFALSPSARAVKPPPDGGYPNQNTAEGEDALLSWTFGWNNTATGFRALFSNTSAYSNTATGAFALYLDTTGQYNTAIGAEALENNDTGNGNTATGALALLVSSGDDNTANGTSALLRLRDGSHNIALGSNAGVKLTNGNNNIDIGNEGVAHESNTIRIGRERGERIHTGTYIAGIANATVTGSPVYIDVSSGQLGLLTSSERFKDGIQPMGNASEALLSLRPVTFRYKKNIDPKSAPQFGLVAEDVEKANPDLVALDDQGKPYTVRYEAVNAMLLNEFLKEHRKVAEQEATITELKAELRATATRQQKQIDALTASLQKVNAQMAAASPSHGELEASKRVSQTVVLNNR